MSAAPSRSRLPPKEHALRFHGRLPNEAASAVFAKRRIMLLCAALLMVLAAVSLLQSSHLHGLHLFHGQEGFSNDRSQRMGDVTSGRGTPGVTSVVDYLTDVRELDDGDLGYAQPGRHQRVLGFVGIQTGFGSYERRQAIRKTWLSTSKESLHKLEQSLGLAIRFVIGTTDDDGQEKQLLKEMEEFGDFLRLEMRDKYADLNHKTLAFLKEAHKHFDAEYYVKADDDIYLRLDRLAVLLVKERKNNRTYIGCMKKGPVITDRRYKWFEPDAYMLGREYFLHAWGPMYILSGQVVADLVDMPNGSLRMLANEDVTVGLWMLTMNVKYEDERRLCHSTCFLDSIAVWDMPTCAGLCDPSKSMPELHQNESCSKSPTVAIEKTLSRLQRWKRSPR